jgi:hypothetical protein
MQTHWALSIAVSISKWGCDEAVQFLGSLIYQDRVISLLGQVQRAYPNCLLLEPEAHAVKTKIGLSDRSREHLYHPATDGTPSSASSVHYQRIMGARK